MAVNKVALFYAFLLAATAAIAIWAAAALLPSTLARPPLFGDMRTFDLSQPPGPAPEISFSDLSGNTLGLDDFRGEVLLVNFWATWCAPCLRELPSLERLQAALSGEEFRLIALSIDLEGAEKVAPFLAENGFDALPTYLDPTGGTATSFGVFGMPTTILIDRRGREVGRYIGPAEWDEPEAVALIRFFLEG